MYEGCKMSRFNSSKASCQNKLQVAKCTDRLSDHNHRAGDPAGATFLRLFPPPFGLSACACWVQGFEANYMHYAFARACRPDGTCQAYDRSYVQYWVPVFVLRCASADLFRVSGMCRACTEVSRGDLAARPLFLRAFSSGVRGGLLIPRRPIVPRTRRLHY